MSSGTYTFSSLCTSTGTPSPLFQTVMRLAAFSSGGGHRDVRCRAGSQHGWQDGMCSRRVG